MPCCPSEPHHVWLPRISDHFTASARRRLSAGHVGHERDRRDRQDGLRQPLSSSTEDATDTVAVLDLRRAALSAQVRMPFGQSSFIPAGSWLITSQISPESMACASSENTSRVAASAPMGCGASLAETPSRNSSTSHRRADDHLLVGLERNDGKLAVTAELGLAEKGRLNENISIFEQPPNHATQAFSAARKRGDGFDDSTRSSVTRLTVASPGWTSILKPRSRHILSIAALSANTSPSN